MLQGLPSCPDPSGPPGWRRGAVSHAPSTRSVPAVLLAAPPPPSPPVHAERTFRASMLPARLLSVDIKYAPVRLLGVHCVEITTAPLLQTDDGAIGRRGRVLHGADAQICFLGASPSAHPPLQEPPKCPRCQRRAPQAVSPCNAGYPSTCACPRQSPTAW